jgi:uncharacterized membrane protein
MKTPRLRTALLGSGAAIALLAASGPVAADEIDEMRAQINALQVKVSQMQADETAKPRVAPAAAVEAGSKPKSWKLPGTNTSMSIGGFAKLDFIYDLNGSWGDSTAAPPGGNAGNAQGRFRLHARQSRFFIKTWTPTDWGELATHVEGDFYGDPRSHNQLISNSASLRLRQAYGRLGPVMAGQTWTTWMDLGSLPDIVDFAGPPGLRFLRQAQLRYTHNFGGGTSLALALENPSVAGALVPDLVSGAAAPIAGGLLVPDHTPDFIGKLTHRFSQGHAGLAVVMRQLSTETGIGTPTSTAGTAFSDSAFAWGIAFGGSFSFTPNDKVKLDVVYGDGLGRYMIGSHTSPTIITGATAATLELSTIKAFGFSTSYTHKWNSTLRSTLAYGSAFVDAEDETMATAAATVKGNIPVGTQDRMDQIHVNTIWSPVPQVNFGLEYIYASRRTHNAPNTKGSRIHLGMQYKF